jgi:hypothetical protein
VSFLAVFPYVIVVDGIAIGSQQPVEVDPAEILRRMADPFTSEYYRRLERDFAPLLANLLSGQFKRYPRAANGLRRAI